MTLDPDSGFSETKLRDLRDETQWQAQWASVLKQTVNAPVPQFAVKQSGTIRSGWKTLDGAVVHVQPFVTLTGEAPGKFVSAKIEAKLAASFPGSAPFVSVTYYTGKGERPGARHSQAFQVAWSTRPVPDGPQSLSPASHRVAAQAVLAGRIDTAFDAVQLARPQLISAKCLTPRTDQVHRWSIALRLFGGVLPRDVEEVADRIGAMFGSEYVRVLDSPFGCTIVAGAAPVPDLEV